jgi:hypothetical protein
MACLTGCQSLEELDIWPLAYYEHDPEKQKTRLDLLGPLYSYQDAPEGTSYAFRPIFVGEFPKDREFSEMLFCWPLGLFRQEPDQTRIWVLPAYYYNDRKRPEMGERDFDWFFLPFFAFGGTDTQEGSYLELLGWGNIKGLLGYDEIELRPFPFYVKARDGEYVTRGYLWPFFRFGEGGGKHFSFYCFLYSSYEKEGKFSRRTYLWPFVHYNQEDLHKKHPRTEFEVFPFYGEAVSDISVSRTILWPFFSYANNTKSGYSELNCPWPFYKTRTDKEIKEFRIWPFYWDFTRDMGNLGKEEELVLFWPIYWRSTSDYLTYHKESSYVLPFYWNHAKQGKGKDGKSSQRIKFWPLLGYEKKEDETVRYRAISPLWFEDYLPYGLEKAWVPFWTLFDYSHGPKGGETLSLLGPLYQYKANDEQLYHRFLMFSYKKVQNKSRDTRRFSVLGGLFEYRWDKGENKLRLLYLPPFISWGEAEKKR